ncbi:MAG: hemerythrin domain-containing protein [Planctomycetaceae bacterium]|nr:hemerythrin domain-containing protein [Planctomycetaceae bacterium]
MKARPLTLRSDRAFFIQILQFGGVPEKGGTIMSSAHTNSLPQTFLDEHEAVAQKIDELKRFWHQVDELGMGPKYEEMAARIHEFRTEMEQHFAHEESQTELFGALARNASTSGEVDSLRTQHANLLNQLDEFCSRLKQCEGVYHCWQEVRTDFDHFLNELHEHEDSEIILFHKIADQGH